MVACGARCSPRGGRPAATGFRPEETRSRIAIAPVEDFSTPAGQAEEILVEPNKRIEESAKAIDGATNPQASRKEIEELRELVGSLLGAVADDADQQLGAKALEHARAKQRPWRARRGSRRSSAPSCCASGTGSRARPRPQPPSWTMRGDARKSAAHAADRRRLVAELMEIRQGEEALKVVRDLAKQIHEASDMLDDFINHHAARRLAFPEGMPWA